MNESRKIVLKQLRSPYVHPARIAYSFSRTLPTNYGLTLEVTAGQPLIAAGDGNVDFIKVLGARWRNDLGIVRSLAVRIDHGCGVKTWIHGFSHTVAALGPVQRGALLGYSGQDQIFFGLEIEGNLVDPTHANRHLGFMDGFLGYEKATNLHQAPDIVTTTVSLIRSLLWQGVRYFIPPVHVPVRFNLDFNGQGGKSGAAVAGSAMDVWHIVPALDFSPLGTCGYGGYGGNCCGGLVFLGGAQGFFLSDFRGAATKVYFERGLLTSAAGVSAFFDPMLSSWVGGYAGATPYVNSFTLRNLPGGTYDLYVYTNGGITADSTTVYCSVNGAIATVKVATPTSASAWVEDENYVAYPSLSVPSKGNIAITVYGYLSGLQLVRQ